MLLVSAISLSFHLSPPSEMEYSDMGYSDMPHSCGFHQPSAAWEAWIFFFLQEVLKNNLLFVFLSTKKY